MRDDDPDLRLGTEQLMKLFVQAMIDYGDLQELTLRLVDTKQQGKKRIKEIVRFVVDQQGNQRTEQLLLPLLQAILGRESAGEGAGETRKRSLLEVLTLVCHRPTATQLTRMLPLSQHQKQTNPQGTGATLLLGCANGAHAHSPTRCCAGVQIYKIPYVLGKLRDALQASLAVNEDATSDAVHVISSFLLHLVLARDAELRVEVKEEPLVLDMVAALDAVPTQGPELAGTAAARLKQV